jgi:hypothetical protein
MTRRIVRTAAIAIAVAALAAPTALARPADLPPALAKAAQQQEQAREFPTRPIIDRPSYPPSKRPATAQAAATPSTPADAGTSWITIAAIAAGLLAIGGIATGARRLGRSRVAA